MFQISQLTVPSKDNNLCTNDANIITDTDATSHKMNAENNLADEESTTDEVSLNGDRFFYLTKERQFV